MFVLLTTACLVAMEWCLKMVSRRLEQHEHLRPLILLLETIGHATTGVLFWLVCTSVMPEPKSPLQLAETSCYAAALAVIVDIDHFIAAGSLYIKVS